MTHRDSGFVYLSVMAQDNAGAIPSVDVLWNWANYQVCGGSSAGDELACDAHPVTTEPGGSTAENYVVTGWPTLLLIDRTMTIAQADMWPYDAGAVSSLVNQ